ncbi:MAG: DUF975 family protein [Clostridia bacterium]|nr:DUF975 family protein [Clostridia bacterium]
MFEVKTRARVLTRGAKIKGTLLFFAAALPFAGFVLSALLFLLCAFYGPEKTLETWEIMKRYPNLCSNGATAFFLLSAVLFLLFFSSLRFAGKAWFYYITDRNQSRPKSFISLKTGAKMLYCGVLTRIKELAFFALLCAPGLVSAMLVFIFMNGKGIPETALYFGAAATAAQLFSGAVGAFIVSGRYYMTEYLLYLNPLMGVKDAVRSSSGFMRGKLFSTALFRLGMLPRLITEFFPFSFPFAHSYVSLLHAVMREKIFAEDKTKVKSPAVTFYIDKKSRIFEIF